LKFSCPDENGITAGRNCPAETHFFLFGRCVSAEAAADFAALLDLGFRSTFDAADAAFALVTSDLLLPAILLTSFSS
jgi:hypothetical protein